MANPILKDGDPAPDFRAESDAGGEVALADLAGKRTVLYFYPKDNTPGCTTQACDFRDNLARLQSLGIDVFGVSPDSIKSHHKFRDKYELSFPLLSDPEHTLAEAYGVWREKKNYGRVYKGIVRSTFVIAPDGTLERVYDNVRAKGHVERLLKDLA